MYTRSNCCANRTAIPVREQVQAEIDGRSGSAAAQAA